jgi:isopenicillin N synthase-like dioxygenase
LAFQIGEASQIASGGFLVATPHLVRGSSYPNLSRNTFAVFMQPNVNYKLTPELDFAEFTKQVLQRHY